MKSYEHDARKGSQRPRVSVIHGDAAFSDGADVVEFMADLGVNMFPWERYVLDVWCSKGADGKATCTTNGLAVPRQNGKNLVIEGFEAYYLAALGYHILHTAHRVKTAKKSFQRLVKYFTDEKHPELMELVEKIRYTNGEEAIFLKNGGSVEFSARSRAGSRGFDDIQIVIFDEAQDLTDDQLEAIMYTLAASSKGDRTMIFTGTPPDPKSPGTVFARRRKAAFKPDAKRTSWLEWSVKECPPPDSTFEDVKDLVYEVNPSMGYILDEEFAEDEFSTSSIDGFARERLGWWCDYGGVEKVVEAADWKACETDNPPADGALSCAVKFAPDGSEGVLAVCLKPKDGTPYVEIAACRSMNNGVRWFADWLDARRGKIAAVTIDGLSSTSALVSALEERRMPQRMVNTPGSSGVASACAMFADAVKDGSIQHFGQPDLDMAVTMCGKRSIGSNGGFGFDTNDNGDAVLAEAAALAYWTAMTTKRRPGRKAVVL